jgi:hypothetical protein
MPDPVSISISGGCLCGAVRYEAVAAPDYAGYCCCGDCRRASGSAYIPFMGFPAAALRFSGETVQVRSPAFRGGEAVRNRCPTCGSLLFGGVVGESDAHTIYAGSLDDPSFFRPTMALFDRDRPDWAVLPPGLTVFHTMPD